MSPPPFASEPRVHVGAAEERARMGRGVEAVPDRLRPGDPLTIGGQRLGWDRPLISRSPGKPDPVAVWLPIDFTTDRRSPVAAAGVVSPAPPAVPGFEGPSRLPRAGDSLRPGRHGPLAWLTFDVAAEVSRADREPTDAIDGVEWNARHDRACQVGENEPPATDLNGRQDRPHGAVVVITHRRGPATVTVGATVTVVPPGPRSFEAAWVIATQPARVVERPASQTGW